MGTAQGQERAEESQPGCLDPGAASGLLEKGGMWLQAHTEMTWENRNGNCDMKAF